MKVELTQDEILVLIAGPVVAGRDVLYADASARAKLWDALENDDE